MRIEQERKRLGQLKRVALVAFVSACASSAANGQDSVSSDHDSSSFPLRPKLSLTQLFPVADVANNSDRIEFSGKTTGKLLSWGWNPVQADSAGNWFSWTKRRAAVLDIPLVSPEPMQIRLRVGRPPGSSLLPDQELSILWNGNLLHTFEIDEPVKETVFKVPVEFQRFGPNRMQLLPSFWVNLQAVNIGDSSRVLGARIWSVQLERTGAGTPGSGPAASLHEDSILQRPGSVVSYHLALPDGARFRCGINLLAPAPRSNGAESSKVTIALLDEMENEHILYSTTVGRLRREGPLTLDLDLERWQQRFVSLTFSCDAANENQALRNAGVTWLRPRIEGIAPSGPLVEHAIPAGRYNVLVVLFDTLRADYIGPYGGPVNTPAMDSLADSGVVFENAYANSSWTRTSVSSLLTGMYPSSHKVLGGDHRLPEKIAYLPEILREHRYRTLAVINNAVLASEYGLGRGFDAYHEYYRLRETILEQRRSPQAQVEFVWDEYLDPLLDQPSDRPFFFYIHEIDPHAPYTPLPPYNEFYETGFRHNVELAMSNEILGLVRRGAMPLDQTDIEVLRSRYMGEIAFMDGYLAAMMRAMERRGLSQNTIVIFTSDHGEEFMEHGSLSHSWSLYEEVLRVPLILVLPQVLPKAARVQAHVQLVDVLPTLLDILGIERPPAIEGTTLLPHIFSQNATLPYRPVYAKLRPDDWASVRFKEWKLLEHSLGDLREYSLFNLASDPGETLDRWPEEPVIGMALRQMLAWREMLGALRPGADAERVDLQTLDEETLDNLRTLGYIQ